MAFMSATVFYTSPTAFGPSNNNKWRWWVWTAATSRRTEVGWLGLWVGGHLHSSNEPGELSPWLFHVHESSTNIVVDVRPHPNTASVDAAYCYRPSSEVCLSVCQPCKTAEPTEMPFGFRIRGYWSKHVLDGGAHWRHLANTTERPCAAAIRPFCQIFSTTCYYYIISVLGVL